MSTLTFEITGQDDVQRALSELSGDRLLRAVAMASNKIGAKLRTEASRQIRARYVIDAATVRASMNLHMARVKVGQVDAQLSIFGSPTRAGRSMNMIRFLERKVTLAEGRRRKRDGTQNQLRFKVRKDKGLQPIAGAFVGNKGRTIFMREGKTRLPIKALQVIGVSQMFNSHAVRDAVMARMEKEYYVEVRRAVDQVLRTS